jgi:hypothetical protein
VSRRFVESYQRAGLRGLAGFFSVTLKEIKNVKRLGSADSVGPYWKTSAVRTETRVDRERTETVRDGEVSCDTCFAGAIVNAIRAPRIDASTWTGDDIFYTEDLHGTVFTSLRFAEMVADQRLTGVRLIPSVAYTWDPLGRLEGRSRR